MPAGYGIERMPVVDTRPLFRRERDALLDLLRSLDKDQWRRETVCEGWSVHDVALHLLWGDISNLSRRRDDYFSRPQDQPDTLDDLGSLIEFVNTLNDRWIVGARRMSPEILISLLEVVGHQFADWVNGVDILAMGEGIGWAGPEPAPVWLDIAREFSERWVHQQHIRDAVEIPGATEPLFLKPILATFAMALPFALRNSDSPSGAVARLEITGESGGIWDAVYQDSGWSFSTETRKDPVAVLTIDQETAWRLFTKGITIDQVRTNSAQSGDSKLTDAMLNMVTILA